MLTLNYSFKTALAISIGLALTACGSSSNSNNKALSLKILHINDHHSHLTEENEDLIFENVGKTRIKMGGFPRVVAKFKELEASSTVPVLKLHAGDAVAGTLFYTLFQGKADTEMMNKICFDAYTMGNHEFDFGDAGLKKHLDNLSTPTCQTAVLGANIIPKVGTPLAPTTTTDYIKPYFVKTVDGEKIAVIGLNIATKTSKSSNPLVTTKFLDEATTAQKYIDELKQDGINKIILLTHYQYKQDKMLAKKLSGVDVIVGGDSHTLLGDKLTDFGLDPKGSYPTQTTDKNNNPVCVVQAWQHAALVGELNVDFDKDGNVTSCSGTPHLLLGNSFKQKNQAGERVELTGAKLQAINNQIATTPELSIVEKDADTAQALAVYADEAEELAKQPVGTATEDLCFERIPGQGRSLIDGCKEKTNAHGSDISNIVALAFKEQSLEADFAIQNGGGVRIDIPAGSISTGQAYSLLPFANTLVNLQMTGAEIKQVLEEAVDFAVFEDGGSSGAYPYASGLRWNIDLTKPKGQRIQNLQMKKKTESTWSALIANDNYTIVTNSYIAGGKDGYATFATITDAKRVDTYLDYAQSFVDYVKRIGGTVNKLPVEEYSTQEFVNKEGVLQL